VQQRCADAPSQTTGTLRDGSGSPPGSARQSWRRGRTRRRSAPPPPCPPRGRWIRWGTTEAQEVRVGTLGDIVGSARGLEPPVVAVIGEGVRLRQRLAWTVDVPRALQAS